MARPTTVQASNFLRSIRNFPDASFIVLSEKWPTGNPPTINVGRSASRSPVATASMGFGDPIVVKATTLSGEILLSISFKDSLLSFISGGPEDGTTEAWYNCSISAVNRSVFLGRRARGSIVIT